MVIEVVVKKWGNSMGIILPKELVNKEGLKENQKVFIELIREVDLSPVFGTLKGKLKLSAQQFKNEIRKQDYLNENKKWKKLAS